MAFKATVIVRVGEDVQRPGIAEQLANGGDVPTPSPKEDISAFFSADAETARLALDEAMMRATGFVASVYPTPKGN